MQDSRFSHLNYPNNSSYESYLQFEKIPAAIFRNSRSGSLFAAGEVAAVIREKQSANEPCRLALGAEPALYNFYEELLRLHREEGLDFSHVQVFQISEYYPIPVDSIQSSSQFLRAHFLDHINIRDMDVHILEASIRREDLNSFCREYERIIEEGGGLDIVIQNIGSGGHIGFNAPGSPRDSKTRIVSLDRVSVISAAGDFYGESHVPHMAFTLGIDTMMKADKVILIAWGEGKAPVLRKIVEEESSDQVPAGIFQDHPDAGILLDESAAEELTRVKTPWFVDTPVWDDRMIKKAVVWLCQELNKPILKLTDRDYNEHHMNDLMTEFGSAYNVNINVFNELQHTITGWPGGKPDADDTNRPERALPAGKRVVIFSPHPDDDVISMGGTFIRLVDQGHEVHVAYQTSGNIAVFDEDVIQYTDFFQNLHHGLGLDNTDASALFAKVHGDIGRKNPGELDSADVKNIKTFIRMSEARASCRLIGIDEERIHFLDMPFYDTGLIRKSPLGSSDIAIITSLLDSIKPHQVYAAGDLSDPHGTHRICLNAIFESLNSLKDAPWIDDCRVWLYRGAWQEWPINEIDMAVPMSPDELMRKRKAIFKHQSQKDSALFPGSDRREFWQRAEARNKGLAVLYDQLGLAEYEAMEGFKRLSIPLG